MNLNDSFQQSDYFSPSIENGNCYSFRELLKWEKGARKSSAEHWLEEKRSNMITEPMAVLSV